jgi:hypothetical protein
MCVVTGHQQRGWLLEACSGSSFSNNKWLVDNPTPLHPCHGALSKGHTKHQLTYPSHLTFLSFLFAFLSILQEKGNRLLNPPLVF